MPVVLYSRLEALLIQQHPKGRYMYNDILRSLEEFFTVINVHIIKGKMGGPS